MNKWDELFMDFITSFNLTIHNGSVVDDIFGEFTSVNYNGSSVVNYTCVSQELLHQITSFTGGELTIFSDRNPCFCTLQIKSTFFWVNISWNHSKMSQKDKKAFYETQEDGPTKQKLTNLVNFTGTNDNDVGHFNTENIGIYQEIANKIIPPELRLVMRKTTIEQKKKNVVE